MGGPANVAAPVAQAIGGALDPAIFAIIREGLKGASKYFDKIDKVQNAPLYAMFQQVSQLLSGAQGQQGAGQGQTPGMSPPGMPGMQPGMQQGPVMPRVPGAGFNPGSLPTPGIMGG